jgi:1,4-alpha-glucan branching enzyme
MLIKNYNFSFLYLIYSIIMLIPDFVRKDPGLRPFGQTVVGRLRKAYNMEKQLLNGKKSLSEFAMGHHYFGLHRLENGWILREWAPNATKIYLVGEFTQWKLNEDFVLNHVGDGKWELFLESEVLKHGDLYKLYMCWPGGSGDRIPAWARCVVQDSGNFIFNAKVWHPPTQYQWKHKVPDNDDYFPLIYEAHPGMATSEYRVGTWEEFRTRILPRIHEAGYNTIQLMAVQEHPFYGSFGYHVSNFFAPSSRFGTPDELKALVDDAHGMGIRVIMDIVHSHAVKNEVEGISRYDGTYYQFFHQGERGDHPAWDSRCFDYGKAQVLHFLLSNCRYWIEEFKFDGFRFDGVTSMLYLDHGLGSNFMSYDQYFNLNQDEEAISYLFLANKLIHELNPHAISIAEEMSGMPGLATPQKLGGLGFDYRLAMGVPDFWIKTIKEHKVEFWNVGNIFYQLANKRMDEKTVHYAESHDQALVGDKTIIFWLMDKDMYFDMHVSHQNLVVDNGIALHKMIRMITLVTAGNGYLNFMGNEFGHPEWIDFPGAHNNWSYHYARRQWHLADNPDLKFKYLGNFDKDMIKMAKDNHLLKDPVIAKYMEHIDNQVLILGRAGLLFVFNFSPFRSYSDFAVDVPQGKYKLVICSDDQDFGGFGRVDKSIDYLATRKNLPGDDGILKLYIPALTAFVLKKV